ncbi:unnamed protein product [Ilex paraguariensis]|uniref:Uncharacterized protein n=1 Tax=Ilex paraguariensis TaxID=185542 RepID=A0ABC8RFU4_9AQUA
MKNMVWSNLKLPFTTAGRYRKERVDSLMNKSNVNTEYREALRTKSYIDICCKVQGQLETKTIDKLSSPSSVPLYFHLSEFLLEPRQETLIAMLEGSNLHHLFVNYFEASLEACKICESLLLSIHQTRSNYQIIERVLKLTQRVDKSSPVHEDDIDDNCHDIFAELASFALIKNPLSTLSPGQLGDIHDRHSLLFHRLTAKCQKIRRRTRLIKCYKKVVGSVLVVAYSALAITLFVLAVHSMVGTIAALGLIACSLGLLKKRRKTITPERLELDAQLDVAAKGVYILINDFDTMSRLVRRLYDEIEHSRAMADMCVRNGNNEVLKEVVKDFRNNESRFLEQLEELEEHIYLCFLTINRSRKLLVQEIMVQKSK